MEPEATEGHSCMVVIGIGQRMGRRGTQGNPLRGNPEGAGAVGIGWECGLQESRGLGQGGKPCIPDVHSLCILPVWEGGRGIVPVPHLPIFLQDRGGCCPSVPLLGVPVLGSLPHSTDAEHISISTEGGICLKESPCAMAEGAGIHSHTLPQGRGLWSLASGREWGILPPLVAKVAGSHEPWAEQGSRPNLRADGATGSMPLSTITGQMMAVQPSSSPTEAVTVLSVP
jgi:hypothetical protein